MFSILLCHVNVDEVYVHPFVHWTHQCKGVVQQRASRDELSPFLLEQDFIQSTAGRIEVSVKFILLYAYNSRVYAFSFYNYDCGGEMMSLEIVDWDIEHLRIVKDGKKQFLGLVWFSGIYS